MIYRKLSTIAGFTGYAVLTLLLFCSNRFDNSTNLGNDVLIDNDPSLNQIDKNIGKFTDSLNVTSMGSVMLGSDYRPAGLHKNKLQTGIQNFELAVGYINFRLSPLWSSGLKGKQSSIDHIALVLSFSDTIKATDSLDNDVIRVDTITKSDSVRINPSRFVVSSQRTYPAALFLDSTKHFVTIPLDSLYRDSIRSACDDSLSTTSIGFAVQTQRYRQFTATTEYPQLLIYYHDGDSLKKFVLHANFVDFSVFENDPLGVYNNFAMASWGTGRQCKIGLYLKPLWDSVYTTSTQGIYRNILSASLTMTVGRILQPDDSPYVFMKMMPPYTPDISLNDSLIINRIAFEKFGHTPEITLPIQDLLQQFHGIKPDTAYLYLSLESTASRFGSLLFLNQPKIKTSIVFSNPR